MKTNFADAMRSATLATRAQDVVSATQIILQAVTGRSASQEKDAATAPKTPAALRLISRKPESRDRAASAPPNAEQRETQFRANGSPRVRMPLGDVLRALREGIPASPPIVPGSRRRPSSRPAPGPDGAQFLTRSFLCAAGARDYKVYVPASGSDAPRGLIVMLHGCTQNPDDFAAGTNMNAVAETHGLMVAYPHQPQSANASACWNWFNPSDQIRDAGEPSIIAGLTQNVVAEFAVDSRRVFVAGLSAGGAMAAVMGATYPDLYAGVGVHSGLAYRSARDVASAFATMRGPSGLDFAASSNGALAKGPAVPTIVFHGSRDRTVHPANAERIVEAARDGLATAMDREDIRGVEGGRGYARAIFSGPGGVPAIEFWRIDGAGHAWSGGRHEGSFADPRGPNASAEMVRFFLAQAPRA